MKAAAIEIETVTLPGAWDEVSQAGWLFRSFVDVRNAVVTHFWGGDRSHELTANSLWARVSAESEVEEWFGLVALIDGEPVGRAYLSRSLLESTHVGDVDVMVLPVARRRGVGTALADAIHEVSDQHEITALQCFVDHRSPAGAVLTPPTGIGQVGADSDEVRMLLRYRYQLEQVERMSELRLADATAQLAARQAEAKRHAYPGYRTETWQGLTPERWVNSLAELHARMSVDAPSAGLEQEAEDWDVDRLRRYESGKLDGGYTLLRAVAIHQHTNEVVAFTTIFGVGGEAVWYQGDTLVHGEHRGHRLGLLVKAANLTALGVISPSARVVTWNAEENRPMLAVNEALGFTQLCAEGAWQRR